MTQCVHGERYLVFTDSSDGDASDFYFVRQERRVEDDLYDGLMELFEEKSSRPPETCQKTQGGMVLAARHKGEQQGHFSYIYRPINLECQLPMGPIYLGEFDWNSRWVDGDLSEW